MVREENIMKDRWIALYVENQVGVLAKVSGLFSGKSYNLQSLTVGTTEDETVSRMTICVTSDDITMVSSTTTWTMRHLNRSKSS